MRALLWWEVVMDMKTSIVILTLNQFSHTLRCLESIRQHTKEPYELIIVDNDSTDITPLYLMLQPDVILIKNKENVGFAKGCNQGAALATGDYILYLNNDTIVTPNWLTNMLNALHSSEDIGMVGPLTNFSSGHQQINYCSSDQQTALTYTDLQGLYNFAIQHTAKFVGKATEVQKIIGFCMLVKRSLHEEIGWFDERYGLGNYEDDDLCLRTANAGYRMLIAHDTYIHHVGNATISQLENESLSQLMQTNWNEAYNKWGTDIHGLLYKTSASFSFCIYWTDSANCLHKCLASIQEVADEIIVIDNSKQNKQPSLPVEVKWCKFVEESKESEYSIWQQALSSATMDYVLLMRSSEYLLARERRQLRALKRALTPEVNAVMMKADSIYADQVGEPKEQVRLIHCQANLDLALRPDLNDNLNQYMRSTICIEKTKKVDVYIYPDTGKIAWDNRLLKYLETFINGTESTI